VINGGPVETRFETDLSRDEVLEFVSAFDSATFFHSPVWLEILSESFPRFECGWVAARDGGKLAGLMPVARVTKGPAFMLQSLPFGTYGDPLSSDPVVRQTVLDTFFSIASSPRCTGASANLVGFRGEVGTPRGWRCRIEECRVITLPDSFEEYRSRGMSRKRRQLCNRCEREGVVARRLEGERDLEMFYDIYFHGASEWGGVHPYPKEFFASLFRHDSEGICFWGAFLGDSLLAAHVDFYFGRMAQAWQAGVTPQAHEFDAAAYLVMVAVREAIGRGISVFNLGSSSGDTGMIFFKESMGGAEYLYPVVEKKRRWLEWLRRR
jgi:hypothetical protein